MSTINRTAYKALSPQARARHDFLFELERHHGVRVERTGPNTAKAYVDAPVATAIVLRFGAGFSLTIAEVVGRSAAVELATFADLRRCQYAVLTFVQSAVER
jgi:hypothetical protein